MLHFEAYLDHTVFVGGCKKGRGGNPSGFAPAGNDNELATQIIPIIYGNRNKNTPLRF